MTYFAHQLRSERAIRRYASTSIVSFFQNKGQQIEHNHHTAQKIGDNACFRKYFFHSIADAGNLPNKDVSQSTQVNSVCMRHHLANELPDN